MNKPKTKALQFGHGCEPWKTKNCGRSRESNSRLQFGHGCEPWKTQDVMRQRDEWEQLQFGHGCEPWKTDDAGGGGDNQQPASIRPRL